MLLGSVKANQIHLAVLVEYSEKMEIAHFSGLEPGSIEFWELLVVIVQPKRKAAEMGQTRRSDLRSRAGPCRGSIAFMLDGAVLEAHCTSRIFFFVT